MASSCNNVAVLLMIVIVAAEMAGEMVEAQSCSGKLSGLNVCGEFVVPGAANNNPSAECCSALQAVPNDCLCSTLRFASSLPSRCNHPPLSCPN